MPKNLLKSDKLLKTNDFRRECPQCSGKMELSKKHLFEVEHFTTEAKELLKEKKDDSKEQLLELMNRAQKKSQKIETPNQSVNIGFKRTDDNFFKAQAWGKILNCYQYEEA